MLPWYRALLAETIGNDDERLKNINATNCVGTVLSLNGPRKYYCMYEPMKQRRRRVGDFLGFGGDDSDYDDDEGEDRLRFNEGDKLFESDLLEGLSTWMERLCEGNIKRFRISKWPPMPL